MDTSELKIHKCNRYPDTNWEDVVVSVRGVTIVIENPMSRSMIERGRRITKSKWTVLKDGKNQGSFKTKMEAYEKLNEIFAQVTKQIWPELAREGS